MNLTGIHWQEALDIARATGLLRSKALLLLGLYYFMTMLSAAFDGISMVLLISLLTNNLTSGLFDNFLIQAISSVFNYFGWELGFESLLLVVSVMLITKTLLFFSTLAIEAWVGAVMRQRIQEASFSKVLRGDWEQLVALRVGSMAGAMTEEASLTTKYFMAAVKTLYFVIGFIILIGIAISVSFELTLLMAVVGIPLILLLRAIFALQARLSKKQTIARQSFAADITERLNNLFQIKVEGKTNSYIKSGLREQERLTQLELYTGYCQAGINSFNSILLVIVLIAFYLWTEMRNVSIASALPTFAGIGVIGTRAASQLNGMLASLGNLARLAGSVLPLHRLFSIDAEPAREVISEPLTRIEVINAQYRYTKEKGVEGINCVVEIGRPLAVRGPSGSGKTTVANLIAGIYRPQSGNVFYFTGSGNKYDSHTHRVHVGYVTQDIYLFHGSIKDNLRQTNDEVSDEMIWQCLAQVGASQFVESLGGLNAQISEAGRSLSGGEKRRLAIARALIAKPDILILDEIMTGLDVARKQEIGSLVEALSNNILTIAITHEPTEFTDWTALLLTPLP